MEAVVLDRPKRLRITVPLKARRPLFGRHGRKVVAGLCGWELVALLPGSPVPTISHTVNERKLLGVALLGMLAHHWYVELVDPSP